MYFKFFQYVAAAKAILRRGSFFRSSCSLLLPQPACNPNGTDIILFFICFNPLSPAIKIRKKAIGKIVTVNPWLTVKNKQTI